MIKLRDLLTETPVTNYPELRDDLLDVFQNFGGPAGRGQGSTFKNYDAFYRLGKNFPFKQPKIIFRGLSLESGLVVNDALINKIKSGIRSYTKYKSVAVKYTWSGIYSPTRILLIVENPDCILSGDKVNIVSKNLIGHDVLDEGEYIFDAKDTTIIDTQTIEDKKGFLLHIVTLK